MFFFSVKVGEKIEERNICKPRCSPLLIIKLFFLNETIPGRWLEEIKIFHLITSLSRIVSMISL